MSSLELSAVIGFAGDVTSGLLLQDDDEHLIYPLGSNVVIKNLVKNTQRFLSKDGHDHALSCLTMSHDGSMLATGQITHMGFPAVAIVWHLETGHIRHRFALHKGKIQALAFSHDDQYLATLGGEDDNKLVIWSIETGDAVCGAPASNDTATSVKFFNTQLRLVTAGKYNLRIWECDLANRKIRPTDCRLGSIKRVANAIEIDGDDQFIYVGTSSGDLLRVNVKAHLFKDAGPRKKPMANGIRVVTLADNGDILVGAGDGTVALLRSSDLSVVRSHQFDGAISSITLNKDHFFVGTTKSNIHLVHVKSFDNELRSTCHFGRINDICFPDGYSELFITASVNDIRVWNSRLRTELLRIHIKGLQSLCVTLTRDGKSIISGWNDGKIRAFRPQSGQVMYVIHDAHEDGVTAITTTSDGKRIISGGGDGRVRVWAIGEHRQVMAASLKEHKAKVTLIRVKSDDTECVSSSLDGSCIVWDLVSYLRLNAMFASTQFNAIIYHPDDSQLLTTGTDRKITYWDAVDGNAIRIVDGSNAGEMTSLDISADGEMFITGSADKLVKLWGYDEGHCYFFGLGHSGAIRRVAISPDQKSIVSVGEEGAVFIWTMPPSTLLRAPFPEGVVTQSAKHESVTGPVEPVPESAAS